MGERGTKGKKQKGMQKVIFPDQTKKHWKGGFGGEITTEEKGKHWMSGPREGN